jgi:hypothetical protein
MTSCPTVLAHARRWRRWVALGTGIAAMALSACSSSSTHHEVGLRCAPGTPRVAPADYLHGIGQPTTAASFVSATSGAREFSPSRARLVGPHSSFSLDRIAVTNRLSAIAACAWQLPGPISASAHHQLVLAQFDEAHAYTPGLPECLNSNALACLDYQPATIIIGKRSHVLPLGTIIIASVPTGVPVALQMNDGGRPQDLDLRTGRRTREASSLYYPVPQASPGVGARITVQWGPVRRGLNFYGSDLAIALYGGVGAEATLAPYDDSRKWAPRGRAWLLLSLNMIPAFDDRWGVRLDVARSFALTLPDSVRIRATGGFATYQASRRPAPGKVSLLFDVPVAVRTFRLWFTPAATFSPPNRFAPPLHLTGGHTYGNTHITVKLPTN